MNSMDSTKMIDICNISNELEEFIKKLGPDSDVLLRGMWLDFKPFLMDLRAKKMERIIKESTH